MDTSNSPENETEEITWQDDENRATLFLRSVFVLLSGALILRILMQPAAGNWYVEIVNSLILTFVFPISIIWFFFGQGLRPVEWLTDQKYNAWNYGVNFKDGKTQLRWAIPLLALGIVGTLLYKSFFLKGEISITLMGWVTATVILWFSLIFLAWFVFGFLWFGCAQGFGPIAATACIIIVLSCGILRSFDLQEIVLTLSVYLPFVLLCSYVCWKQKSWIPILYSVVLLAPIASCILTF